MTTTTETYLSTQTSFTNETNTTTSTTTNNEDQSSTIAANVTIDELVQSCCSEVLPSSSQLNSSSSASPTHLVRFVHSQSSLVSQIDEQQRPSEQGTINSSSSHDTTVKQQPPLINITRLPSPFKPKTIIESTNSMQNTTNLSNITANNISVNNYNVNIHTTNVQQQQTNILNTEHMTKTCQLDEKQTTEIVSQILKNIKEADEHQTNTSTTTNYNIHIDSFNFSSTNEQQHHSTVIKKTRVRKEAKALTRIIVKDELNSTSPVRPKKTAKSLSATHLSATNSSQPIEFIAVPYGWQRRILAPDLVVYLSPTNTILDSLDSVRQYLESPTSCKCGLQCPLIVDKVFNFDSTIKSKSWEVTQVLDGTHCRQKSNILEMATLTNCIDSFCETEQKPAKRRKRTHAETTNGSVFVCAPNSSNILQTSNESTVFVNSTNQTQVEGGQSMAWTQLHQAGVTPPSKRPRGRPRKTVVTPPVMAQLAVKPSYDNLQQIQPVPSSILSPPASVSSNSQTTLVHRNSTSPSTHQNNNTNNSHRYINDNVLTPSSTTDTNVIARVPSLFEQVKPTTNESTFAVLSGVQNVLLSPNRDTNNNNKRVRVESASSIVSTTGKPVTLNVNALKPDFVRSPAAAQKPCPTTSNQIDVISLAGTSNQTQLMLAKPAPKPIVPLSSTTNSDEYSLVKSSNEQTNESSQPLMIDFNDPSTTNFLLSALASGASSDSNAIVNHLFQKAQTQQQQQRTNTSPSPPTTIVPPLTTTTSSSSSATTTTTTLVSTPTATIKKKLPIISLGLKNCTETTNLLPIGNSTIRQPVVLHVPTTTITNDYSQQSQQIIFSSNNNSGERKQPQQILLINNKRYVIQQELSSDQSSQQRLVLAPSTNQSDEPSVHHATHQNRNIAPAQHNSTNSNGPSTLDDGGNCLVVNGVVEPRTLSTLLKGLNPSSFSGVDNLIDTINRFEHTASTEQNDNVLLKPVRANTKANPTRKTNPDKPPPKRRASKKVKQEAQSQQVQVTMPPPPPPPPATSVISASIQPIVTDQHQWQTDFNSFDFTTAWGSDTNLNSLLLNDDFDTAASFDDVNFGDFEPYMNGNNNPNPSDTILPSLFGKPLPPDTLPGVDHLLP